MSADSASDDGTPKAEEKPIHHLLPKEVKHVERRRKAAFKADPAAESWTDQESLDKEKVGLALSGGGIRSAMFNLGLLQAFMHRGLMRYIDYVSSVSGGGYISGYLASEVNCADPTTSFHDQPRSRRHTKGDPDLGVCPRTNKQKPDYRFEKGNYLDDLIGLGWRYLSSGVMVFLFCLSGLGMLACLLALFWRSFDLPTFRNDYLALNFIDFGDELTIALLPVIGCVLFFWLPIIVLRAVKSWWGVHVIPALFETLLAAPFLFAYLDGATAWCCLIGLAALWTGVRAGVQRLIERRADSNSSVLSQGLWLFYRPWVSFIVLAAALIGFVRVNTFAWFLILGWALLYVSLSYFAANRSDDQRLNYLGRVYLRVTLGALIVAVAVYLGNGETSLFQSSFQLNHFLTYLTVIATVFQVVALFGADSLLKSNRDDAPSWQKYAFNILTYAAFSAPVFLVIHWMAREDVSSFAEFRDPDLVPEDVTDWTGFSRVIAKASPERAGAARHLAELSHKLTDLQKNLQGDPTWPRYKRRPIATLGGTAKALALSLGSLVGANELSEQQEVWRDLRTRSDVYLVALNNDWLDSWQLSTFLVGEVKRRGGKGDQTSEKPTEEAAPQNAVDDAPGAMGTESEAAKAGGDSDKWDGVPAFPDDVAPEAYLSQYSGEVNRLKAYWQKSMSLPPADWPEHDVKDFNRLLLEVLYPQQIRPRKMVSTFIVPAKDQAARVEWLAVWGCLFTVLTFVVDFNRHSPIYDFYWSKLRHQFIVCKDALQPACSAVQRANADSNDLQLATLDTCARGMPYHLFCSAVQLQQPGEVEGSVEIKNLPFIFSPEYCSYWKTPDQGWHAETNDYLKGIRVVDAVAMSASAVTPLMNGNLPLSTLMTAASFRLGQWLPNPKLWSNEKCESDSQVAGSESQEASKEHESFWAKLKRVPQKLRDACNAVRRKIWPDTSGVWLEEEFRARVTTKTRRDWKLGFVADGGFREYLGVEELLRRRCRLIIVSDSGCNTGRNEFESLADAIRLARTDHGTEFLDLDHDQPVDVDRFRRRKLESDEADRSPQQFLCLRIRYPADGTFGPQEGMLIYIQMSLTGREEVDLQQFRKRHPSFPDEPTSNQFFDTGQVESYRQLGYHIASTLCSEMPPASDQPEYRMFKTVREAPRRPHRLADVNQARQWLTYSEVEARLRLAYLNECFREVHRDARDLTGDTVFGSASGVGVPIVQDAPHLDPFISQMEDCSAGKWLDRYENDADFRIFHRMRAYELLRGHQTPHKIGMTLQAGVGRVALTVLAFHEFLTAPQQAVGIDKLFQVGGRDQLLNRTEELLSNPAMGAVLDREILQGMAWPLAPPAAPLIGIAKEVFKTNGHETVTRFITDYLYPSRAGANRAKDLIHIRRATRQGDSEGLATLLSERIGTHKLWMHVPVERRFASNYGPMLVEESLASPSRPNGAEARTV